MIRIKGRQDFAKGMGHVKAPKQKGASCLKTGEKVTETNTCTGKHRSKKSQGVTHGAAYPLPCRLPSIGMGITNLIAFSPGLPPLTSQHPHVPLSQKRSKHSSFGLDFRRKSLCDKESFRAKAWVVLREHKVWEKACVKS